MVVPTPDVAVRVSDDTVAEVESLLGHRFASRATLLEAMTHASVDEETRAAAGLGARNNERLEWLGDGAWLGGVLLRTWGACHVGGPKAVAVVRVCNTVSFTVVQAVSQCVAVV